MIKNKDKIERWVPSEIHYPLTLLCFRHVTEQYKIGQPGSISSKHDQPAGRNTVLYCIHVRYPVKCDLVTETQQREQGRSSTQGLAIATSGGLRRT